MIERTARRQNGVEGEKVTPEKNIVAIHVSGLGKFSTEEWKQSIALREGFLTSMPKVLRMCQFDVVASRVRVKPCDFGASAKLEWL